MQMGHVTVKLIVIWKKLPRFKNVLLIVKLKYEDPKQIFFVVMFFLDNILIPV